MVSIERIQVRSILGDTPYLTDCRQLGTPSPAAVNPGAYVIIIGQGEEGAVSFSPDTLKYSELLGEQIVPFVHDRCLTVDVP